MTNKKVFRLFTHKLCFFLVDCIFGFLSAFNPRQTSSSLTLTFRTKTELITCLHSKRNTSLRRRLHKQYILMKFSLKVKLDKVLKEIWIICRKCFWIINAEKGGEDGKKVGIYDWEKVCLKCLHRISLSLFWEFFYLLRWETENFNSISHWEHFLTNNINICLTNKTFPRDEKRKVFREKQSKKCLFN